MATWPGRLVALVVVGAVIGGVTLVARGNGAAPKVDLRTTTVTRGSVTQTVSVSGSVSAFGQARLSFKTGGKLEKVYVVTGQAVTLGQPLAKLDTTDLETALATAQQNLASAQANYQKAQLAAADTQQSLADTQRTTAANIASAQQSLAKLKTNYATAKTNYGTYSVGTTTDTNAFQTDIETTRLQLEAVLSELLTSGQAEVKSAQNSIYLTFTPIANIAANNTSLLQPALTDYQTARNALLSTVADFDNAFASGADTTASAAAYQTAQVNFSLASSRLSSALDSTSGGFSGIQSNVVSAQGQLTTSTTKYIGPPYDQWRTDLSNLYTLIGTELARASTAKLKLGQVANVTVDALTGQKMTGKVTSLDPVATISQGVPVYGIDVAIDVPATTLKAGMSGTAAVILASKQNVLTVPNTTIRTVSGQRGVQVLKGREVVDTAVTFGLSNDTVTEVVSGLTEGDTVIIPQAKANTSAQPNRGGGPGGVIIDR